MAKLWLLTFVLVALAAGQVNAWHHRHNGGSGGYNNYPPSGNGGNNGGGNNQYNFNQLINLLKQKGFNIFADVLAQDAGSNIINAVNNGQQLTVFAADDKAMQRANPPRQNVQGILGEHFATGYFPASVLITLGQTGQLGTLGPYVITKISPTNNNQVAFGLVDYNPNPPRVGSNFQVVIPNAIVTSQIIVHGVDGVLVYQ